MNIKTRFDLGQKVWLIVNASRNMKPNCSFCDGVGKVFIEGAGKKVVSQKCPECYGHGYISKYSPEEWKPEFESTIGKIDIEYYDQREKRKNSINYMLYYSGVGSGSVLKEENLFASLEEAQAECDKRNKVK